MAVPYQPAPVQPQAWPPAAAATAATRPSYFPPVMGLIGLLSALLGIASGWYVVGVSIMGIQVNAEYGMTGCHLNSPQMPGGPTTGGGCDLIVNGAGMGSAVLAPLVLSLGALLLLALPSALMFVRKVQPRLGGVLMLVGGVMALLAPLILVATAPGGFVAGPWMGGAFGSPTTGPWASFQGTATAPAGGGFFTATFSWGPGFGWFASFFTGVLGIIAGVSAFMGKPGPVAVRPKQQYMAQPGFAYGYPQGGVPGYGYPQAGIPAYGYPQAGAPAYGYPYAAAPAYAAPAAPAQAGGTASVQAPMYAAAAPVYAQTQPAAPAAQAAAPTRFCPYCGANNWAVATACHKCGMSLVS